MNLRAHIKNACLVATIFVYTFCVCVFESCTREEGAAISVDPPSDVTLSRLDLAVARYATLDSSRRESVADSFAPGISALMVMNGGGREVTDSLLEAYSHSGVVTMFTPVVEKVFPEGSPYIDTLRNTLAGVVALSEKKVPEHIYTIVTPFNQSVVIADSIVLLGLNHFLGKDFEGYKGRFPQYSLSMKTPSYAPYALAEGVWATAYPFTKKGRADVLSGMIYYGALMRAVVESVPGGDIFKALGYSDAEARWAEAHERDVWNTIVGKNLLYSQNSTDIAGLLSPAPFAGIVSPGSPGMIGRYIGYKIVQSWLENNTHLEVSQMLSPAFYTGQKTLRQAAYSPH